jgi:S-DNA-T family DNA segregation ATPase FtsK/SpoIIIE
VRIQGAFVDEEETEAITDYVKKLGPPQYINDEVFFDDEEEGGEYEGEAGNDPLFEKALEIVIAQGKGSTSYLQRRLKVGYNRAARLVEEMEMRGIVGPAQGSKPREVIHVPKGSL